MKKYLVTGFSGFVGRHFIEHLYEHGEPAEVLGVDMADPDFDLARKGPVACRFEKIDLLDRDRVRGLMDRFRPDRLLHLASFSSVAFSWMEPAMSFLNNTGIFLNLAEAVRGLGLSCRILSVGSAEGYGSAAAGGAPVREDMPLDPVNPYGVARVSQELLSKVYCDGFGMDIVTTRSFNHIGPRQKEIFVVASFARQVALLKKRGLSRGTLNAGDVSVVRDFLDVRDVVCAYRLLFEKGEKGGIYNVASGIGRPLREIIAMIGRECGVEVEVRTDPSLVRPTDNRVLIGSSEKLRADTGWSPRIPLERSIADIVAYWDSVP